MNPLFAFLAAALLAQPVMASPPAYQDYMAERPEMRLGERETGMEIPDLALLDRINREVNAIPYRADPEGQDLWGENFDCEEYVLAKLERLLAAGVPRGAMHMATADLWGRGHLVLIVRPGLVLDNLRQEVEYLDNYPGKILAEETASGWRPVATDIGLEVFLQ